MIVRVGLFCIVGALLAAAFVVLLVPEPVVRAEIDSEEACPAALIGRVESAAIRARPYLVSRRVGVLESGDVAYLCEDRGNWVGVIAPLAKGGCAAALLAPDEPMSELCLPGWILRAQVTFAAG